jgi:hypothetical protein
MVKFLTIVLHLFDSPWNCKTATRVTRYGEFLPLKRLHTLGRFFNCQSSPNFGLLFTEKRFSVDFDEKKDWAIFWAIFTQKHLVTQTAADLQLSKIILTLFSTSVKL